jgi:hypothetical protein
VPSRVRQDDGLAETGTAEEAGLAAADERREQVDHLDARLEELRSRGELGDRRRIAVDRPTLLRFHGAAVVDRLAQQVEHAAERGLAHRHRERGAGIDHRLAANQAVGRAECHAANLAAAEMLLHLADQVDGDALLVAVDAHGVVDRGDRVLGKLNVERRADDLGDLAGSLRCRCHVDSCLS